MPLRDHLAILSDEGRPWVGFHGMWASCVLQKLNCEQLSRDYCAGLDVHKPYFTMPRFEATPDQIIPTRTPDNGFPPMPALSAVTPFDEPRTTDVTVMCEGTHQLVAVVLFAHRGFTESAHGRRAFAVKSAMWLQRGTSVVAVNADSPADVHGDLVSLLGQVDPLAWRASTGYSVTAYRPVAIGDDARLDVWPYPLAVGKPLPTVPLWLAPDLAIPLDLEATYQDACRSLRIE